MRLQELGDNPDRLPHRFVDETALPDLLDCFYFTDLLLREKTLPPIAGLEGSLSDAPILKGMPRLEYAYNSIFCALVL